MNFSFLMIKIFRNIFFLFIGTQISEDFEENLLIRQNGNIQNPFFTLLPITKKVITSTPTEDQKNVYLNDPSLEFNTTSADTQSKCFNKSY